VGSSLANRPALIAFIGLAAGMATSWGWWHCLLVVPVAWVSGWNRGGLVAAAALLLGIFVRPGPPGPLPLEGVRLRLTATVISVPYETVGRQVFDADTPLGKLRVTPRDPSDLRLGDRLVLTGKVKTPDQAAPRRSSRGDMTQAEVEDVQRGFVGWLWAQKARESFRAFLAGGLTSRPAALMQALCFGVTSDIDRKDMEAIRESGASHLVAASGFNVVIVGTALLGVLSFLPVPRWAQLLTLLCVLIVYAGAAGLGSPIVRAILMTAIHLGAEAVRREPDSLSSASGAGAISLILDPSDVAGIGFWLSYTAVFALIAYSKSDFLEVWLRMPQIPFAKKARDLIVTSLVAGLATAPISAAVFGEAPVWGLLTNLLVAPLCGLLTLVSLGLWVAWLFAPFLGEMALEWAVEPLLGFILMALHGVASLPAAVVTVPPLPVWLLPVAGLWAALLWRDRIRPDRD
jgi:ComEC/Rec2-related protein